ncbi:hypothetical protein M885DRAFT_592153 [Pelagophyceae sp. CCMP2097]|nr:hypothetical protein M885DRAFT_592153 [Pelagophyceae sp. CCMP2097]
MAHLWMASLALSLAAPASCFLAPGSAPSRIAAQRALEPEGEAEARPKKSRGDGAPAEDAAAAPSAVAPSEAASAASSSELADYWAAHGALWQPVLRSYDVRAAWLSGELDGILPSGATSRDKAGERFIALAKAIELFDAGKIDVRRRFRGAAAADVEARWQRVAARRQQLRSAGTWAKAVSESEKTRAYEAALIAGNVESADASPAAARAVATLLSPALRAAANQRNKADGGVLLALSELQATAGATADERWLTASLLADLEQEVALLAPRAKEPQSYSKQADAARDEADGNGGALIGVAAAVAVFVVQQLLFNSGGAPPDPSGGLVGFPTI